MAHNLSNIILKQQIQGTMTASRSNTLTNFRLGKSFSPTLSGGTSSPDADVIYAFKATADGASGAASTDKVVLTFSASEIDQDSGSPIITNTSDDNGGAVLDAEGSTVSTLHTSNGRIVSVFCYTNPGEHRGNITIDDESADSRHIPKFVFVAGGAGVKSLFFTPHIAPAALNLRISFSQRADELNVVVLGKSA